MYYVIYKGGPLDGQWEVSDMVGTHGKVFGHEEGYYRWILTQRVNSKDITVVWGEWYVPITYF